MFENLSGYGRNTVYSWVVFICFNVVLSVGSICKYNQQTKLSKLENVTNIRKDTKPKSPKYTYTSPYNNC